MYSYKKIVVENTYLNPNLFLMLLKSCFVSFISNMNLLFDFCLVDFLFPCFQALEIFSLDIRIPYKIKRCAERGHLVFEFLYIYTTVRIKYHVSISYRIKRLSCPDCAMLCDDFI